MIIASNLSQKCRWNSNHPLAIYNARYHSDLSFTKCLQNQKGKIDLSFLGTPRGGSLARPGVVDLIRNDPRIITHRQILTGQGSIGFTDPDNGGRHSMEQEHDVTHVWVGGVMGAVPVAPQVISHINHFGRGMIWSRSMTSLTAGMDRVMGAVPVVPLVISNTYLRRRGYGRDIAWRRSTMTLRCGWAELWDCPVTQILVGGVIGGTYQGAGACCHSCVGGRSYGGCPRRISGNQEIKQSCK